MKTKIGILGLVMSFLFIGCNKDDQTNAPMSAEDLTVNANMDEMSDDLSKIAMDIYTKQTVAVGKNVNDVSAFLPDCATIGDSDSGNNWVRTIDFGNSGCTLKNGNVLKGKIIVTGSYDFTQTPYTITCSFDNFHHNDSLIEGSKILIRTMESTPNLESDHPVLTMNVNLKVSSLNGVARNVSGTRVRELVAGLDTPLVWLDDVYLISGNQSVNSPKGTINSTITTPLKLKMNFKYVVQGVVGYTKNGKTATLDYGDGTDDNEATCTINGVVKMILLGVETITKP